MPDVHITIKNLPQIRAAFGSAPRLMNRNFRIALTKSAIFVMEQSKLRTPVLSGYLQRSHQFNIRGGGLGMTAEIGPTAFYGIFVHEGTRFMRGRPFLRQGAEASLHQIQGFFTEATQGVLNDIGKMT